MFGSSFKQTSSGQSAGAEQLLPPGQSRVPSYSHLSWAIAAVGSGVDNVGTLKIPGMSA